jgi:hypothetical protein
VIDGQVIPLREVGADSQGRCSHSSGSSVQAASCDGASRLANAGTRGEACSLGIAESRGHSPVSRAVWNASPGARSRPQSKQSGTSSWTSWWLRRSRTEKPLSRRPCGSHQGHGAPTLHPKRLACSRSGTWRRRPRFRPPQARSRAACLGPSHTPGHWATASRSSRRGMRGRERSRFPPR